MRDFYVENENYDPWMEGGEGSCSICADAVGYEEASVGDSSCPRCGWGGICEGCADEIAKHHKSDKRYRCDECAGWSDEEAADELKAMSAESFAAPEHAYAMAYNDGHRDGRNKIGYDPSAVKLDRQTFRDAYKMRAESFEAITDEWVINRKRSNPLSRHYVPQKSAESFAAQRKPPWSAANPKPNRIIECGECDAKGYIHGRECSKCDGAGFWKIESPKCAICGDWIAGTDGAECDECDKWYCDAHYDIDNDSCVVCGDPMTDSQSMMKHSEDYRWENCDNERSFLISILSDRQLDEFLEFEEDSYSADTEKCSVCDDSAVHVLKKGEIVLCDKHYQQQFGKYSRKNAESFSAEKCGSCDKKFIGVDDGEHGPHSVMQTDGVRKEVICTTCFDNGMYMACRNCDNYFADRYLELDPNDESYETSPLCWECYDSLPEKDQWDAETFESPVSCKICGKTFASFRGLNGHMNAHLPSHRKRAEEDSCYVCKKEVSVGSPETGECQECKAFFHYPHCDKGAGFTNDPMSWFCSPCATSIVWSAETKLGKDSCCCGATKTNPCACMIQGVMNCNATCPCSLAKKNAESAETDCAVCVKPFYTSMDGSRCLGCDEMFCDDHYDMDMEMCDSCLKTHGAESDSEWNCVICGHKSTGYGHNPEPVASFQSGRCCDTCNTTVVIPTRLRGAFRADYEIDMSGPYGSQYSGTLKEIKEAEEGCSCPVCGTQTEVIREHFDDDTSWVDLIVCDNCCWMEELEGNEEEYEAYMEELLALQDEEPDANLLEKPNVVVDTSWDWSDGVGPSSSQQTLDLDFEAEGQEIYWNASCQPCYWENRFISTDKGQLPDHCPHCNKAVTLVAVDVENNLLAAEGDEELTDEEKQEVWNVFQEEAASIEDPDLEQIKTLADKYLTDVIDDEVPEFFVDPGLEDYYQYILTDPTYPEGGEPEDEEAAAMFEELKQVRYWATILTDEHIKQADTAAKAMMAAGLMGDDKELFDQGRLGLETNNQVQRERELIAQWLAEGGVHEN